MRTTTSERTRQLVGIPRRYLAFTHLGLAIGTAFLSFSASAGVVNPGDSITVNPGDPVEYWSGEQGSLTLAPGSAASGVSLRLQSTFRMDNASIVGSRTGGILQLNSSTGEIRGSTISNSANRGLVVGYTSDPGIVYPGSEVDVYDSSITGYGIGVIVDGAGNVRLRNTAVTGTLSSSTTEGVGVHLRAGTIALSDRSNVIGATTGLDITRNTSGGDVAGGGSVLIDASRVEGVAGHAILVRETGEAVVSDITLRNGAALVAGNGVLLEVRDAATVAFNVESSTLTGNIVNGAAATTNVNLSNNASITGSFDNVTSATLASGGRWQLADDSDVGALTLNSGGTVALGDGTAFNTLTVSGDYVGAGGTLLFNTVLADDASASDTLIVGGSTSGQTNVAVNNVGGAGAQTVNGIQLIQVGGTSAGVFTLAGRAVGGQYEYFLHQGTTAAPADGNWYLRSELPVVPDPCLADPTLPGCTPIVVPPDPDPCVTNPSGPGCVITPPDPCVVDPALPQCQPPIPVLRPEPGAYLANQAAATQMFGMRLSDRTGGTARGLAERGA